MKIVSKKWIRKPDENGNGFLEAEFTDGVFGAPVPVETHNVSLDEVKLGKEQDFFMILEAAGGVELFSDEKDYAVRSGSSMAVESYIPSGLFSPTQDPAFQQTPTVIIGGRVSKTYDDPVALGFGENDQLVSFDVDGVEFDAVISKAVAELDKVAVGNIIHGVFWVQGWPDQD